MNEFTKEELANPSKPAHFAFLVYTMRRAYAEAVGVDFPSWEVIGRRTISDVMAQLAAWEGKRPEEARVTTPENSHKVALDAMLADGWTFGPEFDSVKKQDPHMRTYWALPFFQLHSDAVMSAVLIPLLEKRSHEKRLQDVGPMHAKIVFPETK